MKGIVKKFKTDKNTFMSVIMKTAWKNFKSGEYSKFSDSLEAAWLEAGLLMLEM